METCRFLNIDTAMIITGEEESILELDEYRVKVIPFWKWALLDRID